MNLWLLRPGRVGGIELWLRQLLAELPALDRELSLVLLTAPDNHDCFEDGPRVARRRLSRREWARLDAAALGELGLDLWFCPLLVLAPERPGLPSVAMIPDLQHAAHPEYFTPEILAWRRHHYAVTARHADGLLTLSEFSKRELVDGLGVAPGRVEVAAPAGSPWVREEVSAVEIARVRARHRLPEDFLFYPAKDWPHKDHQTLLEALALVRERDGAPQPLILTGGSLSHRPAWFDTARRLGVAEAVRDLGLVDERDLAGLYAAARALVFPSRYEGFGMPVLEALRAGCPVVASDLPSLRAIAGEAALWCEPGDALQLAEAIAGLPARPRQAPAWRERIAVGRKRARGVRWSDAAARTLHLFERVTGTRRPRQAAAAGGRPLVSVVVPSFEQGEYLGRTLDSALGQDWPALEVLVMDGGSQDGSAALLRERAARDPRLKLRIGPDAGQAAAINEGFDAARGDLVCWLNSDDVLLPGALGQVVREFTGRPGCDVLYGRALYIDSLDRVLGECPVRPRFERAALGDACFLAQPAVFLRRRVIEAGERLDPGLETCLDYEFWLRLSPRYVFAFSEARLAATRLHPRAKTLKQRPQVFAEAFAVVRRHCGRVPAAWTAGRAAFLLARAGLLDGAPDLPPSPGRIHLPLRVRVLARLLQAWEALPRELRSPGAAA